MYSAFPISMDDNFVSAHLFTRASILEKVLSSPCRLEFGIFFCAKPQICEDGIVAFLLLACSLFPLVIELSTHPSDAQRESHLRAPKSPSPPTAFLSLAYPPPRFEA